MNYKAELALHMQNCHKRSLGVPTADTSPKSLRATSHFKDRTSQLSIDNLGIT